MRHLLAAQLAVTGPDHLVLGFAVDESDAQRVLAVGGQRRDLTLLSADGGTTWTTITSPGKGLRGAFLDGPLVWIVGEYGYIARSSDGGDTWTEIDVGFEGCLFGVTRDAHGTIIVAGDGGRILASSDGVTFKNVTGIKVSLSRLYKCSAGVFIPTDAPGDVVHVGTDAKGKTTATLRKVGAGGDLMTTTMASNGTMVIVGNGGVIFRSTDKGETWTPSTSPTTQLLAGVCALPSGRFVAVGANGTVLFSDDDGVSFAVAPVSTDGKALWACVAVGDHVLVGGSDGRIFRLRDVAVPTTAAELPAGKGVRGVVRGVLVDDELRRMVFPWRGGNIATPVPPLPTAQEAWRIVRTELLGVDNWRSGLLKKPSTASSLRTDPIAAKRRLAARLDDEQVRTGTFLDDAELVAATFEGEWSGFDPRPRDNAIVDLLVVQHGVVGAVERVFAGLRDKLPYSTMGVFERLRERVVTSSDADYAAVLALALPAIERVPRINSYDEQPSAVRSAWAFVLPLGEEPHDVERAVLAEAVRFIGDFGSGRVTSPGVLASVDEAGMTAFFKANDRKPRHEFFAGTSRAYMATALARGLPAVLQHVPSIRPNYDLAVDVWAFVVGHIDDDGVVERLLGEPGMGVFAAQIAAALDPPRFFAAVQKRKSKDGDTVQHLEALLAAPTTSLPASPAFDAQRFAAKPAPTTKALPLPPSPLPVPAALDLAPELTWRDDERAAAESATPYDGHWEWQADDLSDVDAVKDAPPLKNASAATLEAWVALREQLQKPTPSAVFVLLPTRLHPRLLALGTEAGEKGNWSHYRGAMLKNADTIANVRAWLFDEAVDLDDRLTVVQPLGDVHAVPAVVTAFAGKKHKALARSWILRHPRHAAAGALAMIVADIDAANAARVLRFVDGLGHRRTIQQLAATVDIGARVQSLLDDDPLLQKGVKLPTIPAWAKHAALPALKDADGTAWTPERVDALVVRLATSNPDEVNPVVTAARQSLDKTSATAFARALFEAWLKEGTDAKHVFAMHALGFFGDDASIRHLATLAKAWPGESAAARAQMALDTFVLHGGDVALLQLAMISEKSKFAAFKKGAVERITAIADMRGLTPDELADRLVPTMGLDDASSGSASTTIDFGARRFFVTFDESLAPRVKDESGTLLKDLPKPNKSDDATLAAAGKKQLSALKKDVKAIADLLLRRFERMMIEGRSTDVDTFRASFVEHPLTFHVARRVVWEALDESDKRIALFRIAEDKSFADLNDDAWTLPANARVRPVHPIDVDDAALTKASTVWGDYELLQPFAQLGRAVHRLGGSINDVPTSTTLSTHKGKVVPAPTLVFGLEGKGWKRYDIIDGGAFTNHVKLFGDVEAIVDYDGAVGMGYIEASENLTVGTVTVSSKKQRRALSLSEVPPRVLSEIVADLDAALTTKGK